MRADGIHIALLAERLGANDATAIRKQHIIAKRRSLVLTVAQDGQAARDIVGRQRASGGRLTKSMLEKARHELDLVRVTAHGDAVATGDTWARTKLSSARRTPSPAPKTREGSIPSGTVSLIFEASMNLPACMDQAGIIDSDDSNIEQARGCESTGIVKTGMMERTERQVVAILKHGTLDGSHATASVGNGEFLRRGLMRRLRSAITSGGTWSGISAARVPGRLL